MREQLIKMLTRPPRPSAIGTVQAAMEFKKFHAKATKLLAKKLTETEVASLYSEAIKWY